jgi:hypothetical protein
MPRPLDIVLDVDERGEIDPRRRLWMDDQIRLYAGGRVRIQVSRPRRTTRSNAYYWAGVIEPIRRALADAGRPTAAGVLHEYFKAKYLPPRIMECLGHDVVLAPSSSGLDMTSFSDYVEAIKHDEDVRALGVWFEEMPGSLKAFEEAA